LTDIVLIEETVDTAIFLIHSNEKWHGMTGFMGDRLQLLDQSGCILGSCEGQYVLRERVLNKRGK
jgi:hypothetical protein